MIQHLTPHDILATGSVTRWHTLRTARHQSLAEHKARVALLAVWLGHRLPLGRFGAQDELEVLRLALVHDMPETTFGDMPNPSKLAINQLETMDYDALVEGVFWQARGIANPMATGSDLAMKLLRVADVVEAACFYWVEGLTLTRPHVPDLKMAIVSEALAAVGKHLPELHAAVDEVLDAAGVPEVLEGRASA